MRGGRPRRSRRPPARACFKPPALDGNPTPNGPGWYGWWSTKSKTAATRPWFARKAERERPGAALCKPLRQVIEQIVSAVRHDALMPSLDGLPPYRLAKLMWEFA